VVQIGDDPLARGPEGSHLLGSTGTMPRMAHGLVAEVGLSAREVRRLNSTNPRRARGLA
jgi:dihydroorotase-like cyclic amidohydrolase